MHFITFDSVMDQNIQFETVLDYTNTFAYESRSENKVDIANLADDCDIIHLSYDRCYKLSTFFYR